MMETPAMSDDVLNRIAEICDDLPAAERKVATYILANDPVELSMLGVKGFSEMSGASIATVSRLPKRLGFDSFSDFRMGLAQAGIGGCELPAGRGEDPVDGDVASAMNAFLRAKTAEMADTVSRCAPREMEGCVTSILRARRVLFASVGNSIPISMNAAFKLAQMGVHASCPANTEGMSLESSFLEEGDVLLVVSNSGRSKRLSAIVDNAEDSAAHVVVVTNDEGSPLARRATYLLKATSHDRLLTGQLSFSHNSAFFVLDLVSYLVYLRAKNVRERYLLHWKTAKDDKGVPNPLQS